METENILPVYGLSMGILNNKKKGNFPKNSIMHINQGYLTIKDHKNADYYIIGQINECIRPSEDLENYVCQDREVKIYRPRYDPVTGSFLGLY